MSFPALTNAYSGSDVTADSAANQVIYSSVVNTIFNVEDLTPSVFSVALSRAASADNAFGGVLAMGGMPSLTDPEVNVATTVVNVAMASPSFDYTVAIGGILASGGALADAGGLYLVDTGTSFLYTTAAVAADIAAGFGPAAQLDTASGTYVTTCTATAPPVVVSIGGQGFPINPVDLLAGDVGNATALCAITVGVGGDSKTLGGTFLMNVLSIFD